ncbi:MAG TPA: hypothetical protein VG755_29565 [Nannocystaceae bacterium]|nr:hypothetical protein [Nannocystaceae bacterium]
MIRLAIPTSLLLFTACAGPPKDIGALSDGSGSEGSEGSSGGGTVSASSTTAATAQTDDGEAESGTRLDVGDGSDDASGSDDGTKLDVPGECACTADQICTPDGCYGGQIFLNFDGPNMTLGSDDATQDETSISELSGQMSAHGGDAQERAALVAAVRTRFADVSLWITDERPTQGEYAMIVLGDNLAAFGGALEISPLNCGAANPHSVAFAGIYAGDALDVDVSATVVSHGIGHVSGLDHVDDMDAIMGTFAYPDSSFSPGCLPLAGGAGCAGTHGAFCAANQQDSLAELQALYGAG